MRFYSSSQFALFRMVFGIYLLIHFLFLLPYAPEIWSNKGTIADPSLNFTYGIFPDILNYYDSPLSIQLFIGALILLSLLFTLGFQRRFCALLLWYGWACLLNRNNFISNPGIPFAGWLLLACVLIPSGEGWHPFKNRNKDWNISPILFTGAWLIMAIGYTISGIDKLHSPSWVNGTAIAHLLHNPLARNSWFRELLLSFPLPVLKLLSWAILSTEILFLPACLFPKGRMAAWTAMVLIHLGILTIIRFSDLTLGMLMIHLFTFDIRWLGSKYSGLSVNSSPSVTPIS